MYFKQNTAAYLSPYTFSGKERDVETSLSYFGARYYEAGLSIWLSVDPLSEARPYLSSYNYCQLNPVMLVDPTGMLDDQPGDLVGEAASKDGGSVNFFNRLLSQMPTPAPEGLPATMRPSSAEYDQNPMIAGRGGEEKPKSKQIDNLQTGLDLIGLVPVVGELADGINALIYFANGDYTNAALSLAATLPVGGQAATAGKLARKAATKGAADAIPKGFKHVKKFGYSYGQKVYEYKGKYYSKDIDSHNGGAWKVFEDNGGKLKRIGTADKNLVIIGK